MSTVGFSKNNSTIKNGVVYNSSINMNGGVIISHGTPTSPLEVANKAYVDSVSSTGIPVINISLSGVVWTQILISQSGDFTISVKNMITNGPSAKFSLSKNEPSRQAAIIRHTSCAGLITEERLEIRWLPNDGIDLRKNKPGYDGTYQIKYIEND